MTVPISVTLRAAGDDWLRKAAHRSGTIRTEALLRAQMAYACAYAVEQRRGDTCDKDEDYPLCPT